MFEKVLLQNVINKKKFGAEYLEFIESEYFLLPQSRHIFKKIQTYFSEYNSIPSFSELSIDLSQDKNIGEDEFIKCIDYIDEINSSEDSYNDDYIINKTQTWIKERAFENAIIEASEKMRENKDFSYISDKIRDIFSLSFNETIGNSFFRDAEKQQEYYNTTADKFPCNLTKLNEACGGGIERKTINLLMAPTSTGKTTALCSLATSYLRRGLNVLYVTCEMAEQKIRQRIEANLFNTEINDMPSFDKNVYHSKIKHWKGAFKSNLYIKEYPTATASVTHLRALLDNLESKEGFIPDVVLIDYIGIMRSCRIKSGENSYGYHKSIAEELRGLMVEKNMACWSALQSNRDGDGKSDLGLDNSAESYGTPMTADSQFGLIETPELKAQGLQVWKALKTRYADLKGFKFKVLVEHAYGRVSDFREDGTIENEEESQKIVNNRIEQKMKIMKKDNEKKGLVLDFE